MLFRADNGSIEIGENTNIQDGVVLHTDPGYSVKIRKNVIIGHNAMFYGCSVGDNSVIVLGGVLC